MKVILEFDPAEDRNDLTLHLKARDIFSGVYDFDAYLRDQIKYADMTDELRDTLQHIREALRQKLDDHDINLERDYF